MDSAVGPASGAVKVLLACGIVASILHFAADLAVGRLAEGYDLVSQSMSELLAAGAPTRALYAPLDLVAGMLMLAFGVGIWAVAETTGVRVTAIAVMLSTTLVMLATAFFPVHLGEPMNAGANLTNLIVMAVGTVVLWLVAIVSAAVAFSGWFRWVSVATLVAYGLLTIWGLLAPRFASAATRTPTIGLQERTMSYIFLLWVALLSVYLLQAAATAVVPVSEAPFPVP